MILRPISVVLAAFACLTYLAPASAEQAVCDTCNETVVEECAEPSSWSDCLYNNCITRFAYRVVRDTKRNNCWPEPFVRPDRHDARAPFVRMVAKGWQRQNTLGPHHFENETGKLNLAGQTKVRRILLEGLPQHRTIYVHRSLRPSETTAWIDSVQQLAARTVRDGNLPEVLETDLPAPGWSAEQIDAVGRKFQASMPDPRLPKPQGESGEGE